MAGMLQSSALLLLLAASVANGWPGNRMELHTRLQDADIAVLVSREPRADFSCQVMYAKPGLGFDLRFHSDYRATVPIKALADAGDWLQVLMRITPAADRENPVYLVRRFAIPDVPLEGKGDVMLAGGFDLGLGRYRVDWMMRDARQRVCSSHWDLEAKLGHSDRDLPLTLGPNMVADWERIPLAIAFRPSGTSRNH